MIAILDVHYGRTMARTGCVLIDAWTDAGPRAVRVGVAYVTADGMPKDEAAACIRPTQDSPDDQNGRSTGPGEVGLTLESDQLIHEPEVIVEYRQESTP